MSLEKEAHRDLEAVLSSFFGSKEYSGTRNHDKLIGAIWHCRQEPELATFEHLYRAVWDQDPRKLAVKSCEKNFDVHKTRANKALAQFCNSDFKARRLSFEVTIARRRTSDRRAKEYYQLVTKRRVRPELSRTELFWDRYVDHPRAPLIISTEPPVFLHSKLRCFIRFLDISADHTDASGLTEQANSYLERLSREHPEAEKTFREILLEGHPVYHYQPSGEVLSALSLESWFTKHLPPPTLRPQQKGSIRLLVPDVRDYETRNSIILGNWRTNRFIRELQADNAFLPLEITASEILNRGSGASFMDSSEHSYALMTRIALPNQGIERMVIAGNNGRAIQGAVDTLTDEEGLKGLFLNLAISFSDPVPTVPTWIQALFKGNITRNNSYLVSDLIQSYSSPDRRDS